jgi:hypothetical protein
MLTVSYAVVVMLFVSYAECFNGACNYAFSYAVVVVLAVSNAHCCHADCCYTECN